MKESDDSGRLGGCWSEEAGDEGLDAERRDASSTVAEDEGGGFATSRISGVMVLASEGDAGCSDHGKYWTSVIVDGAEILLSNFSSFGVDAPSVPVDRWRSVVDPEVGVDGGEVGGRDGLRPRTVSFSFGRCFFLVVVGSELSCCEGVAGLDEGAVGSLAKGRPLFLWAAAEIWLPMW